MRRSERIARHLLLLLCPVGAGLAAAPLLAQDALPAKVESRTVDVWSDGTRLSGDLFYPEGKGADDSYPGIVMSHGWGGTRAHLNQAYAPFVAAEGFVVLTIDYRGWGDSDSRLVLLGEQPEPDENGEATVKVKLVREVVDPFDQTEDIRNAITWLQGEPGVDPEQIGLWGSSYSGGHVIWVAAHDARVKATVSQVASMDSVGFIAEGRFFPGLEAAHQSAIAMARGEAGPVPQHAAAPNLRGTPYYERIAHYSPRDVAHLSRAAALIIDAAKEELFDIKENGQAVYSILKNRVPAKYVVIEGIAHYDIYRDHREEALQLAIDWFKQQLVK